MSITEASAVESTTMIFLEESIVGHYKLLKTIGKGQFALVMSAKNMVTREEVAIKIIDKTRFTPDGVRVLYEEIRILKILNHPNIVKLLDVMDTKETLYLIMEYISGGDLFGYLEQHGSLNEKEARAMFRQIVSAVEYCHQKRIIHRDLKDENILLDSDMNIKLIDFGLSRELAPGSKLQSLCGSLEYMAPEIYLSKQYGPEVDVWALGVILYVLLTNCTPFSSGTPEDLRTQILLCDFKIPHFLSTDCGDLLKKMLVVNRAMRSSLTSIMKEKWINEEYEDELKPYMT